MKEITGKTKLLAVIGNPIAHSLSPRIHNFFAEEMGLSYAYMAFDIQGAQLRGFFDAARTLGITGFNMTMPLKELALPFIDVLDADARKYGAVNTVVQKDGLFYGYNTDGDGFLMALEYGGHQLRQNQHALILGAGGAAKAVALALVKIGVRVSMASRRAGELPPIEGVAYCHWGKLSEAAKGCSLLVNATPLGMHGMEADFQELSFLDALAPGAMVCDLIYVPPCTALLKAAKSKGLASMNGLPHLVCQAALAFERFTREMPPGELIERLLRSIENE